MARPTVIKLDDKMIEQAEKLAGCGLTSLQISEYFGWSRATFYNKQKEYPELLDAIKRGRQKVHAKIGKSLVDQALKGNLTAAIFYLKTKCGWVDPTPREGGGANEQEVKININKLRAANDTADA